MQEFPLSNLKIKLKGKDNPTSVFKKPSFLSLNCINNKSIKSKTPLRAFTGGELPHYILPIKSHLNRNENNEKNKIKKKGKKPTVKLTIFSRNKSYKEIKSKKNSEAKNNNKENNIYNTITFNKSNLNTNSHPINDYSSSNKDNNEKIISELNIINQNNNNINNSFEEPSYHSLISELQKKISEQNILLSSRKKEIENLKKQIENNKNNQIIELDKEKEKEKEKNEINKLEEEIKSLKNDIENITNKYQIELDNKKDIEQKYKFLKDSMKESHLKQKDINKYEDKIIEQENKIISLQEELTEMKNIKNKQHKISKESSFEIISPKKNLILSKKNFEDIQLILNALFDLNKDEQNNLSEQLDNAILNTIEIDKLSIDICTKLKLKEKDNYIIQHYIHDLILKLKSESNPSEFDLEKLFKYKYNEDINNTGNYLMTDFKYKKIIYEKCKKYDYKNKHKIPFYYFKHLYKEICYKNKKDFSLNEFYNLLYECKNSQGEGMYSLYDILYENLNKEINVIKINFEYKLKYPDLVKNFLDKIIKEAYDKKKENSGNNHLNRAKSFEQDFFEQSILDNKSDNNKINLDE